MKFVQCIKKIYSSVILSVGIIFIVPCQALTVTNSNDKCIGNLTIEFSYPSEWAAANPDNAEACWKNDAERIYDVYLEFGESISTGLYLENAPPKRICLIAKYGGEIYAINPVVDVPECHINFVKIKGKNKGALHATPECKFVGNSTSIPGC